MPTHKTDFPFEEIKDKNGNYFNSVGHALKEGFDVDQIWSVTEDGNTFVYGPGYHQVNLIGVIATKERHDGHTYYEEKIF
jgi:hypothetical protein|tara:strand:+ start:2166 stop:2405 length:240 start_codon:yes stop_codon:yes gene_type:complete